MYICAWERSQQKLSASGGGRYGKMHALTVFLIMMLPIALCWRLQRRRALLSCNLHSGSYYSDKYLHQVEIVDYDNIKVWQYEDTRASSLSLSLLLLFIHSFTYFKKHQRPVTVLDIPHTDENRGNPPTVVLLGTAQTVKTFTHHCRDFSHHSRLVVPELRCQGTTKLLTNKCSVDQQVIDLEHILNELDIKKCNLIGFSFGGRVAIAFAANRAKYVNKKRLMVE